MKLVYMVRLSNGPIDRNEEDLQKKFIECLHMKNIFIFVNPPSFSSFGPFDNISGEYDFSTSKKTMRAEK